MIRPRTALAFAIALVLAPTLAHAQSGTATPQDTDTTTAATQQSQGDAAGAQDAATQGRTAEQDPPRASDAATRDAADAQRRGSGRVGERSTANPAQTGRDSIGPQIGAQGDARGNAASGAAAGTATTRSMGAAGGAWGTLDADGDGRVSEDEGRVDAEFRANFDTLDADGDGFVSPDEYRDGRPDARTDRSGRDR